MFSATELLLEQDHCGEGFCGAFYVGALERGWRVVLSSGGSFLCGEGVQKSFGGVSMSGGQSISVRVQDTLGE